MIIKVQYENQDNIYEIPVERVLEFLDVTKSEIEAACKKAIMRI